MTRSPTENDPLHGQLTVSQLIEEAARPYLHLKSRIVIEVAATDVADPAGRAEPLGERRPGVIYGLGNLIENAMDFARSEVRITGSWNSQDIVITVVDDGPGSTLI